MKPFKPLEPQLPPETKSSHPEITSFAVVKRDKQWHCIATKSRGREITDERVLGSFDWQDAACDLMETTFRRAYLYNLNVWVMP